MHVLTAARKTATNIGVIVSEDLSIQLLMHCSGGAARTFSCGFDPVSWAWVQGYCFCEYVNAAASDYVIQALNGKPIGTNNFVTKLYQSVILLCSFRGHLCLFLSVE